MDGKQVDVASKSLDSLEESGVKTGKGIKSAESSIDSLSDSSADASKSVKGASDSLDYLGDSGSKTSKDLKGVDGAIDGVSDSSADASKSVKGTSDSLDGMSDSAGDAANQAKKMKNETEGMGQETGKATIGIKNLVASLGLVAIASSAFNVLKSSLDDAISRFDTLNTFPKVLQALGVSAEDSERAMSRLSDGIDGLPTTLNDIASNAQRMYTSFNDMDKATDTALALNNALLGSGSSAVQAQRGTEQYLKALQTGKVDMMMWNTLSETMDVGLIKIAEGFGFAGKSAKSDLYEALKHGSISMDAFNEKLIEVGTGTGIMAELAKENSLGLSTSIGNLMNAASRGVANIIDSFNKLTQEVTGKDIAQNIDSLKHIVNASFKAIGSAIEGAAPFIIFFSDGVKATIPIVEALTPALVGLAAAYTIHKTINLVTDALKANAAVVAIATVAKNVYAVATNRLALAMALAIVKTKIAGVAIAAYNTIIGVAVAVQALLATGMSLTSIATIGLSGAITILSTAINILKGPVGWVTLAIGALTGAVIGIVKWFNRTSEEAKALNADTEALAESTDALSESINGTSESYKKSQNEITNTAKANEELAQKVDELSSKENKSAAEKAMLSSYVEQLNGSVDGLNLAYSEEADALNMSSEGLQARLDLMKEEEAGIAARERMVEISKEQNEVDMKLVETNELRKEWNQKLEDGTVKSKEHKTAIAELDEQEQVLKETTKELGDQQEIAEEQFTIAMENITEATKESVDSQIVLFDELSEAQQTTVESMKATWDDYKDAATDMFDVLNDEIEITASEMKANLDENQRVLGEWADNIATLAERGVDEGLLNTLREAGPESAGHVNALVKASDAELKELSVAFAEGGGVATDALSKSLGIEDSGILDAVGHLVIDTEKALADSIKKADFESLGVDIAKGQADGISKGTPEAEKAAKDMAKATEDAARKESETHSPSKVFERVGTDLTDGLTLGINNGTSTVTQAIQKMFKAIEVDSVNSFEVIAKSHENAVNQIEKTLSKLPDVTQKSFNNMFERMKTGTDSQIKTMKTFSISLEESLKTMVDNYSSFNADIEKILDELVVITQQGMKNMLERLQNGANLQVEEMKKLAVNLITPFNKTSLQFNIIGKNAMSGLNQGLISGRAQVLATARSIANAIRSTMQSALDINSPSGVMRDDVGRWIPEGIALGIRDNAKSVYRELDNLSNNMIMTSTPEQALGTSRMAYNGRSGTGGGNTFTTNTDKSRLMENQITVNTSDDRVAKEIERAWRRLQFGF